MIALDSVRDQHLQLQEMITDIKAMLKPEVLSIKPNAKLAYEMICSLGVKMKEHLAAQDEGLYPSLLTHQDPQLKSVAWGFINGEKPLRRIFDDYYKKWLKDCDFSFNTEFMTDTRDLLTMLENRINREKTLLLPKLEQTGLFGHLQA